MNKSIDKETVRFLKWTLRNPGLWYLICTPDDKRNTPSNIRTLIEKLAKESFYEVIFVLLMLHRNKKFMESVCFSMLTDIAIGGWQNGQEDKILKKLIEYLE